MRKNCLVVIVMGEFIIKRVLLCILILFFVKEEK